MSPAGLAEPLLQWGPGAGWETSPHDAEDESEESPLLYRAKISADRAILQPRATVGPWVEHAVDEWRLRGRAGGGGELAEEGYRRSRESCQEATLGSVE